MDWGDHGLNAEDSVTRMPFLRSNSTDTPRESIPRDGARARNGAGQPD